MQENKLCEFKVYTNKFTLLIQLTRRHLERSRRILTHTDFDPRFDH